MANPEELLEEARRLWYSDKDALGAQQILDDMMIDHPDSPEAEEARELRDLIAALQPLDESSSDRQKGWRYAVRANAFLIALIFIVLFVSWQSRAHPRLILIIVMAVIGLIAGFLALLFKARRRKPNK